MSWDRTWSEMSALIDGVSSGASLAPVAGIVPGTADMVWSPAASSL
jgi:hypothetical protein